MTSSQPNIFTQEAKRLRNDLASTLELIMARDGAALDISARSFRLVFYHGPTHEEALRVSIGKASEPVGEAPELYRPGGKTDRLVLDLSLDHRATLTENQYDVYVYETTSGRQRTLARIVYRLLDEPDTFIDNQPLEPAALQFNFVTANANLVLVSIYEVPTNSSVGTVFPSLAQALAAPLNGDPFRTIRIGADYFIKDAEGLLPLAVDERIRA